MSKETAACPEKSRMPKISVIIPVYNVESYLPACLDSVDGQSFRDFELILVDDGSTDRSGTLCDEYAAEHPNTRVIHQQNAGLSEARNQGVAASSGEYIAFIDSDDYVAPDCLEYLLSLIEKYGVEISVARVQKFWGETCECLPVKPPEEKLYDAAEALHLLCSGKLGIFACAKLYKRRLVEQFPYPSGRLYEDTATTHKLVGAAEAVAYGTKVVYFWRQRRGSITHDEISEKHFCGIEAAKEQLAYMQRNYPTAAPAAQGLLARKIIDLSYRLVMGKKDLSLFRRMRKELRPVLLPVLKNRKIAPAVKIRAFAVWLGWWPCRLLSLVYTRVKDEEAA